MEPKTWNWRILEFQKSVDCILYSCSAGGCRAMPECFVAYDSIFGNSWRVTAMKKPYCREHAEALVAMKRRESRSSR